MWGPCYTGISLRDNWTRAYYLIYFLRRFIFVSIGFFVKEPIFQLMSLLSLNYITSLYYAKCQPLTNRFDNRLEIVNEFLINLCCMHLACFTDVVPIETQQKYGWSLVFTVGALCVVNLLVMFTQLARYCALVTLKYWKRLEHWVQKGLETPPPAEEVTINPLAIQIVQIEE